MTKRIKRQTDKRTICQKGKKTKRQNKRHNHKRQRRKLEFDIMPGQFCTLMIFFTGNPLKFLKESMENQG